MSAKAHRWIVVLLCVLPVGCGTSVTGLLEEERQLLWDADSIIAVAEELDQGLENSIYDAESAKNEACDFIFETTRERIYQDEISFAQRLWDGFTQIFVSIVPVTPVERCAEAQQRYKNELGFLCRYLEKTGRSISCSD